MVRSRRSLLVVLAVAFGGCTSPATDRTVSGGTAGGSNPNGSRTDSLTVPESTVTEQPEAPDYVTCDPSAVMTPPTGGYQTPPTDLTSERVREYVLALEAAIMLPPEDERTAGSINFDSPTVERVERGYVVYLPVFGGYYNERVEDSTATQHADLPQYTASYFVTEGLVRRASEVDRVDPRESGEVIVCREK